jgi:hypothetical protein
MNITFSNRVNVRTTYAVTVGVSETPNRRTAEKIRSFTSFPDGWHYGSGGPASAKMTQIALDYLYQYIASGFRETDAFFGPDGQIMVTAYHGKHCVEVTVDVDRLFTVSHQFDGEDRFYEPEISSLRASVEVARIVSNIEQEECGTFAWSTPRTTIIGQEDLKISPLRFRAAGAAPPYFMNNVASPPAALYANTLPGSTPESVGNLRSSGYSTIPKSILFAA